MSDDAQVVVSGKSDSYDKVLGKLVEKNKALAEELKLSKDVLESMNPTYEKLATNAQKLADALKNIKPLTKDPYRQSGGNGGGSGGLNETNNVGGGSGGSGGGGGSSSPKSGGKSGGKGSSGGTSFLSGYGNMATTFNKLANAGNQLFNKMNSLLFRFDEVITIPLFIPKLPNFKGKGGGGGSPKTSPVRSPATVPSAKPAALPFGVKNPFATWEPAFATMLARMQAGLNGLKFPNIIPGLVTIPVVFTGLEVAKAFFDSISHPITVPVPAPVPVPVPSPSPSPVPQAEPWYKNPYVQTGLTVAGIGATLLAPEVMLPLEGLAAEGAFGAGLAMTGARVAASGGRIASWGSKAISGASGLGARAAGAAGRGWDYSKGLFQGGMRTMPQYATGGFHIKPHIGVVGDVEEVTLPLNSSASVPAFDRIGSQIADRMTGGGSGGGNTFEIHVGTGANIIADKYSIKRFANEISDQVQYNLRNTGALGLNRK